MADVREGFPLFPLGIVLLPTEIVPLHIFEERYKLMIGECVERETEFGIVWLADDGLKEVGCTARVAQVLDQMEDGRMNILAQGGRPFRLVRKIEELPYPAGDVELLDDPDDEAPPREVLEQARERYADLVARVTDTRPEPEELADLDAYAMAATVDLSLDSKQELLELRSEADRLRMVGELLRKTMKKMEYAERTGELARSNGRVRS
jgi:Lon protease-like protein